MTSERQTLKIGPIGRGFVQEVKTKNGTRFVARWCAYVLDGNGERRRVQCGPQGSQFTAADFLAPLKQRGVLISMDGRGRALDNVFIERLWRSLTYELIYPGDFANGADLMTALGRYFRFYNHQRPHQALGYRTPADLFPRQSIRKKSLL